MVNHWESIIKEQYQLMSQSGLIDACDKIYIGCIGTEICKLKAFVKQHQKLCIAYHSENLQEFEFPTIRLLRVQSIVKKFHGFYIHTKGVSYPGNEGGDYWRDYMNYYNLTKWKDARGKLICGYDTCGVKLRYSTDPPARKLHYSGNFYWFNSDYVKTLPDPCMLNDRFDAEMWIGMNSPNAATLCQLFVDYNTKGKFDPVNKVIGKTYIHTLCYNTPSEVEKTTRLIYEQNDQRHFKHYLIDLGFPVENDTVPVDITKAKKNNSVKLTQIASKYGSTYVRMSNIGVSQNWNQIIKHCKLKDEDIIIGADPDERTIDPGWADAMSTVLSHDPKIGMVSLVMPEQEQLLKTMGGDTFYVKGVRVFKPNKLTNWAMIGFSGRFLKTIGDIPYPKGAPKYGWIESELVPQFIRTGFYWVFLPDYRVYHTDYPRDKGAPKLLREWKNQIIFNIQEYGQIDFEKYLNMKKQGLFPDEHTLKYKTC